MTYQALERLQFSIGYAMNDYPKIGTVIDKRFVLNELIGEGGMSIVYRAHDSALNRDVVLKLIKNVDADAVARTIREAQILSQIQHPHVIRCFQVGRLENNNCYLVLEYINGETLRDYVSKCGVLTVTETLELGVALCDALSAVHNRCIYHRDLKPDNIILGPSRFNDLKVIDFGLGKMDGANADGQSLTQPGELLGTAHYMSPEQGRGERTDHRSDIYSLGCVLYHCLTGIPPYDADTAIGVIYLHFHSPFPAVPLYEKLQGDKRKDSIVSVIARCMAKNRDNRYGSVSELQLDLIEVQRNNEPSFAGLPTEEGTAETAVRLRRMLTFKHGWLSAVVLLGVLAILGTFVGGDWMRQRNDEAEFEKVQKLLLSFANSHSVGAALTADEELEGLKYVKSYILTHPGKRAEIGALTTPLFRARDTDPRTRKIRCEIITLAPPQRDPEECAIALRAYVQLARILSRKRNQQELMDVAQETVRYAVAKTQADYIHPCSSAVQLTELAQVCVDNKLMDLAERTIRIVDDWTISRGCVVRPESAIPNLRHRIEAWRKARQTGSQ